MLQAEARDPAGDEHLTRVVEVARQEDDDRDLGELGGLELDRADLHRQEGAVHLLADPGQARKEQERQTARGDGVAVALEDAVVAQENDRCDEQHQSDDEPLRLLARELLVDPVDHHQPERGEHRGEREQVRVRVGKARADEDVREHAAAQEEQAVGRSHFVCRRTRDQDSAEAGRHKQRGRDQADELAPPCRDH